MKTTNIFVCLCVLVLAGCVPSIQLQHVESFGSIPDIPLTTYQYSGGPSEMFRAVVLKDPESSVEIIPFSLQFIATKGTFNDALAFMAKGKYRHRIIVQDIIYKGETIGYLLAQPKSYGPVYMGTTEINLFERRGRIFVTVDEQFNYGD
jgi:hypothetical protein